jgi:hypothetical protein
MNTPQMTTDLNTFLLKENVSFLDFTERAKKSILHVEILDACHMPIVDVHVKGDLLNETQLIAFFAVLKDFDPEDDTRYGQVYHRRITFWVQEFGENIMNNYGMDAEHFMIYDKESLSCLCNKKVSVEEAHASGLPIMEIRGILYRPNMNPSSFVKPTPSTSYQLMRYLKTLNPEELVDYVRNVDMNGFS